MTGKMEELAHAIRQHQAVLFVGSGGTKTEGGASWGELAADIARELGSAVQSDPQETFDDLCDYQGRRADVYQAVRRRLSQVRASPALARLLRLPWLAIYTTNYDTAIEDSYRAEGILYPKVVWAPERAIQFGIPGEITLFKLMGCRTVDMLSEGEMVLSSVDRVRHQRERGEMYAHLDALVSARTILAVGYSFEDRLLLDAVRQVRSL